MLSPYPELENAIREIDDKDKDVLVAARVAALLHVTRTRPCMNLVQSGADMVNLLSIISTATLPFYCSYDRRRVIQSIVVYQSAATKIFRTQNLS